MKKVSCWRDLDRGVISSNVALVLTSAKSGERIEFEFYEDKILDEMAKIILRSVLEVYGDYIQKQ